MDVRHHPHEPDRLTSLASYQLLDSEPDERFDALTRLAAAVCRTPISMITLVDADREWLLSRHGTAVAAGPRSESISSDVVAAGIPFIMPDLRRTARYAGLAAVADEPGYRAYAAVPLVGRDGLPIGTLSVVDTTPRVFTEPELGALHDLARQTVSVLELQRCDANSGLHSDVLVAEATQPVVLRRALDAGEFVPYFQPLVDMRDGSIRGLEALIRWHHPTRGVLAPSAFLPGLEAGRLGAWASGAVLERSCGLITDLHARGIDLPDGVAINISGDRLTIPGLSDRILARLARHRIPGTAVTVEITETAEIHDVEIARRELLALRAGGVRAVADDFGVGWSNLVRLLQLPLAGLKVDRELVTGVLGDPLRNHMITSTLSLAAAAGLSVIAEGVETAAVRDRLLELGCHYGQGWLFGRPVPADQIFALLTDKARIAPPAVAVS